MFKKFKLFLKLSLKDQILINFTKPTLTSHMSRIIVFELDFFFLSLDDFDLQ
jgi:hypothetical protein